MPEITGDTKNNPDTTIPEQEDVGIETARKILKALWTTPESTFTEESDLSRIGDYDSDQIRQAFAKIAIDIIANSLSKDNEIKDSAVKPTPYGNARLVVNYKVLDGKNIEPWGIWLSLSQSRKIFIDMSLNLEDIEPNTPGREAYDSYFLDDRPNTVSASANQLYNEKNNQIATYRKLFRGMRWVAANLLNWDGEFILPEQLGNRALSPSRPQLQSNK